MSSICSTSFLTLICPLFFELRARRAPELERKISAIGSQCPFFIFSVVTIGIEILYHCDFQSIIHTVVYFAYKYGLVSATCNVDSSTIIVVGLCLEYVCEIFLAVVTQNILATTC